MRQSKVSLFILSKFDPGCPGFSLRIRKSNPASLSSKISNNVHNMALLYAMTQYRISKHFMIPVEINGIINIKAMLDTGATANFIHQDIVRKHGIQMVPRQEVLSHSICIPDNSRFHSDISNRHTHYITCITISIISETIPNINLGVIDIVAIALETSNTGRGLPLSELLLETYRCARTHFFHM